MPSRNNLPEVNNLLSCKTFWVLSCSGFMCDYVLSLSWPKVKIKALSHAKLASLKCFNSHYLTVYSNNPWNFLVLFSLLITWSSWIKLSNISSYPKALWLRKFQTELRKGSLMQWISTCSFVFPSSGSADLIVPRPLWSRELPAQWFWAGELWA